jgi:hypothetical protein
MWVNLTREELKFLQQHIEAIVAGAPIKQKIDEALAIDPAEEMRWAEKAFDIHHKDGECEVDYTSEPLVSHGDEGAYVMSWVWVSNEDMGIEPEDDDEDGEELDEPNCRDCGEKYDGYGDGYNGRCPSCADKAEEEGRADE